MLSSLTYLDLLRSDVRSSECDGSRVLLAVLLVPQKASNEVLGDVVFDYKALT